MQTYNIVESLFLVRKYVKKCIIKTITQIDFSIVLQFWLASGFEDILESVFYKEMSRYSNVNNPIYFKFFTKRVCISKNSPEIAF